MVIKWPRRGSLVNCLIVGALFCCQFECQYTSDYNQPQFLVHNQTLGTKGQSLTPFWTIVNRAGGAEGEQDAEAVLSAGATEDHQERAGTGGEETMFFWCAQTSNSCSSFFHARKMTRMPLRRSSESV